MPTVREVNGGCRSSSLDDTVVCCLGPHIRALGFVEPGPHAGVAEGVTDGVTEGVKTRRS